MTILAGDIGGTKTRLALYRMEGDIPELLAQERYESRRYGTFEEIVDRFLHRFGPYTIDAAAFGIAGPVIEERCRTTNLPWEITAEVLRLRLHTRRVALLNDLEATAYGMLYLPKEAFAQLNPQARARRANRAVIAAGTGLGEALLYFDGTTYHPIATEGGHTDFAPLSPLQERLLAWLKRKIGGHVSYERILSGPGIHALYTFLKEERFAPEPPFMKELREGADPSAKISEGALVYHDPLCRKTLRLFCEIYGAEAGNLALKSMALGGLYIGGGIAPKILPLLQEGDFVRAFADKGRFEALLREIPLRLSLEPKSALLGAMHYAAHRL